MTVVEVSGSRPSSEPSSVFRSIAATVYREGDILGERYEITKLLGMGGMGAVYKAHDIKVGRTVGLKVIRPDLAENPAILARFKQELILARQITHKNIIRIYDLNEADGVNFITMEFVEGEDLRTILTQRGKLATEEAVEIFHQVCAGLNAAHSEGVIHRDLKPANIMRDQSGRVVIMDFGLARTLQGEGMTQTGMMVGTMEYMSPEQATGLELDATSDVYAVGLIAYEMLTGKMPYAADSAVASLLKRSRERAKPMIDVDSTIPRDLSTIVSRCIEPDRKKRYQSTAELIADLEAFQPSAASKARGSVAVRRAPLKAAQTIPAWAKWGAVSVVALLVAGVGLYEWKGRPKPQVTHAPVSVLVGDFTNHTGDPIFEGTLEPMFNVALEGASFISAYDRGEARRYAGKLPHPTDKLDEQAARLVAVSQGVNSIVTGSLSSRSDGYRLSVEAIDAVTGKTIASSEVTAPNKDDLLMKVPKLASPIRKALGDTTPESVQLDATQGSFTASNLEAVQQWSIGMKQQFAGQWEDALKSFSKAAELDPNFARAYAGMAAAAGNLGQTQNAEKYAKLAMEHVDRMTERERYRVRGLYYIRTENWQKCTEEYSELIKQYPADNVGRNNLSFCYARLLNMPKALKVAQEAAQIAPKDVMTRMNSALYACYATDFATCERETQAVLQLNPAYEEAFLVLAYAQLGQEHLGQANETYKKLEKISPWGASLAAVGFANLAMYEGRFRDAVQILENGAAADLSAKNPDAAADKYLMLAYAQSQRREQRAALLAAQSALEHSQSIKTRFLAGQVFVEVGAVDKARKLAGTLGSALQPSTQAYARLLLGEAALKEHRPNEAVRFFTEAQALLDTWIGRFDMGRAYLEAGAFGEADSEFDRCIKRRGEALELFMDDMPTYSYLPLVYYYQGRVREGLKSPGYVESYRTFLSMRGNSTEDPLVPEVRRRIGQQSIQQAIRSN